MSTIPPPESLTSYLIEYSHTLAMGGGADPSRPPVVWLLSSSNGRLLSSLDGPWNTYAHLEEIGGMPAVPVIPMACERLDLFYHGRISTLRPPSPVSFFSFARMAAPCYGSDEGKEEEEEEEGEEMREEGGRRPPRCPIWLYSVFGYSLPEYRVTLLLSETQVSTEVSCHRDLFTPPQ